MSEKTTSLENVEIEKALRMAWAEHPYIEFEQNATAAGLDSVAADIAEKRGAASEQVADEFDKEQAWIKEELFKMMDKMVERVETKREVLLGCFPANEVTDELLRKLHGLLGTSQPDEYEPRHVTVLATNNLSPDKLPKDTLFVARRREDDWGRTTVSYAPAEKRAQLAEWTTSIGLTLREITVDKTVIVSLQPDNEAEVTKEFDKSRRALEKTRAKLLDPEYESKYKTLFENDKKVVEEYGGMSEEEVEAALRAEAADDVATYFDLYKIVG